MDAQVGIRGNGFTMLCCDTRAVQSIITIKEDEDKLVPITKHQMFALSGEAGDRVNFTEFIIANVKLYALRHSDSLTTKAVANFTRSELAKALRQVLPPFSCIGQCCAESSQTQLQAVFASSQTTAVHESHIVWNDTYMSVC